MLNKSIFTRLYDTLNFLRMQVLYKLREANIFICLEFYREQKIRKIRLLNLLLSSWYKKFIIDLYL